MGLRMRLEILLTIGSKLYRGEAVSFFHSGSLLKSSHLALRSAASEKLSMYVRLGMRGPIRVSA